MRELKSNIPLYTHVKEKIQNVFTVENEDEEKVLDVIIDNRLVDVTYNTKGVLYYQGSKIRSFNKFVNVIVSDLENKGVNIDREK